MSSSSSPSAAAGGYAAAGFSTRAVHVGSDPDPVTGAVTPPISLATTFAQRSPGVPSGADHPSSYGRGFEYSRSGNPTRGAFERCLASLEKAKYALAFASGLAATTTLIHMLNSGDHVVCIDDVYGGTQRLFRRVAAPTSSLSFSFVDFNVAGALEAAITERTRMIWMETPTNPTLKLADIEEAARVAHAHGCLLVVDNTFMSPYFQNPLTLGADIVMHSVTKYIGGHSDVVMGVVATSDDAIYERLRFLQNSIGAIPAPFDCFMALRGLKTLALRMREHERNAMAVAQFLESHAAVERVLYPGLASHPQHELAKRQMRGFGGMITFYVRGDITNSRAFLESLKLFTLAESLGAVESLAESPSLMTHASVPPEVRKTLGISDTLVRLSVGVEDLPDLLADLGQALEAAAAATAATATAASTEGK